ncbi:hypothetical protein ACJD0Z_14085 [Flavobacteriaceae bacterium M23B6Z8]
MKNPITKNSLHAKLILPLTTIVFSCLIMGFVSNYKVTWAYDWQGIRANLKDSVLMAAKQPVYFSNIEKQGIRKLIERNFWIQSFATKEELLKLKEYPNGMVRTLAYDGLLKREDFHQKAELLKEALNDTLYFTHTVTGCLGETMLIGEYLMNFRLRINKNLPPPPKNFSAPQLRLSKAEKEELQYLLDQRMRKKEYYIYKSYQMYAP